MTNPRNHDWHSEWEASKDERDDERTFVTTYCNRSHRLIDGEPVAHECVTLPPAALAAERAGDFDSAARIILHHDRVLREGAEEEADALDAAHDQHGNLITHGEGWKR